MADLDIHQAGAELAKRKKSWIPFVTPAASRAGHVLAERSHRRSSRAPASHKTPARAVSRGGARAAARPASRSRAMNVHQAGAKLRRGPSGPTRSRAGSVVGKRSHSHSRAR
jgi:hypothetical protein